MVKILVLFYSTYGHIFQLAESIAKGAKEVEGVQVDVKRVPETLPEEVLQKMGAIDAQKQFAHIPFATIDDLPNYDALIVGDVILFCCLDCCFLPQITFTKLQNHISHHKSHFSSQPVSPHVLD